MAGIQTARERFESDVLAEPWLCCADQRLAEPEGLGPPFSVFPRVPAFGEGAFHHSSAHEDLPGKSNWILRLRVGADKEAGVEVNSDDDSREEPEWVPPESRLSAVCGSRRDGEGEGRAYAPWPGGSSERRGIADSSDSTDQRAVKGKPKRRPAGIRDVKNFTLGEASRVLNEVHELRRDFGIGWVGANVHLGRLPSSAA